MVKSILKKKIVYEEDFNIDNEDLNHESDVYEVNILKLHDRVNIILGKERRDYIEDSVIFFNIYL